MSSLHEVKESSYQLKLFGGEITIKIFDSEKHFTDAAIPLVYEEALRLQKIFNFYDPRSELSRLNKERRMRCSAHLILVLTKAMRYSKETSGRYDPSQGKRILERKSGTGVSAPSCSYNDISINGDEVILIHPDVMVDLGSIAKGYIADRMAGFMQEIGIESGMIDARGDIIVFGGRAELVEIENLGGQYPDMPFLVMYNNAVATSGDYKQFSGTTDNCHIVGDVKNMSVTVVAPALEEADVLATCIMMMDEEEAGKFISGRSNVFAFVITKQNRWYGVNGYKNPLEDE